MFVFDSSQNSKQSHNSKRIDKSYWKKTCPFCCYGKNECANLCRIPNRRSAWHTLFPHFLRCIFVCSLRALRIGFGKVNCDSYLFYVHMKKKIAHFIFAKKEKFSSNCVLHECLHWCLFFVSFRLRIHCFWAEFELETSPNVRKKYCIIKTTAETLTKKSTQPYTKSETIKWRGTS